MLKEVQTLFKFSNFILVLVCLDETLVSFSYPFVARSHDFEPASRPDLAPVIISISAVPGPIPKVAGRVCRKYLTIAISFLFPFTKER